MSDSSYGIRMTSVMTKIAERYPAGTPEDSNPQDGISPAFKNTYPSRVAAEMNIQSANGPDDIIDVCLDTRGIILYISHHITRLYPKLEFKDAPALTPTSLLGYCLGLTYALSLLNDDENVRSKRSVYAREFCTDVELAPLIDDLRNLAVPKFMLDLLKELRFGTDDRKPQLKFVYSHACFDFHHDFGRMLPINIFFIASHIIASQPSNSPPMTTLRTWYQTEVIATPVHRSVYHYLGANPANVYDTNWFSNVLQQIFNPVTSRSNTLRPTLDVFNQSAQNHIDTTIETINPYIYLLALDNTNRSKVIKTLNLISQALNDHVDDCTSLGKVQENIEGIGLLNHYYQNVLKPTYHSIPIEVPEDPKKATLYDLQKHQVYLGSKTHKLNTTMLCPPQNAEYEHGLFLAQNIEYDPAHDPIVYEQLNPRYPPTMNIRHFLPNGTRTDFIYQNIISGKLIEISELDSVAVPHPNPNNSIDRENRYFLESALPLSVIKPIQIAGDQPFCIIRRRQSNPMIPTVRFDLLDRSIDRIPLFGPHIGAHIPEILPGYTITQHLPDVEFACNSISYTIPEESTPVAISEYLHKIPAWSSYRYLNTQQFDTNNLRDKKYMLLNLRTMFGTNVTLIETQHPSQCIPQA